MERAVELAVKNVGEGGPPFGAVYDHVCLLETVKGWLFTGDLFIRPYPKVFLKEESISSYIDSIRKLNEYDYQTVFCGHEGIIQNGRDMMNRKLAYLQKTRSDAIRLHRLGFNDRAIRKRPGKNNVWKFFTSEFGALLLQGAVSV